MEAVWRRLVFHFLWALAILLTGILSGLRVNAVSFAFFASRSLTSLEIFADPPQTPPASLLCPLHGHFAAFSPFWKNCANVVCPSDPKLGGQSHSFATFQVCGEPGKCSKASCEWYYAWPQVVSMSIFPNCFSEFSSKLVVLNIFFKNVFFIALPSRLLKWLFGLECHFYANVFRILREHHSTLIWKSFWNMACVCTCSGIWHPA